MPGRMRTLPHRKEHGMVHHIEVETVEQAARNLAYRNAGGPMPAYVADLPKHLYDAFCKAYNDKANKPAVCRRVRR